MYKTSLFIGRFQPLHIGHFIILKQIADASRLLKIGIGSAQYSNMHDNPLSAEERKEMLGIVLKEQNITNAKIYFIPDIHDDARWVEHVKKIVGAFDIVHSGNDCVIRLFKEKHIPVQIIKEIDPYEATKIRKAICQDHTIEQHVPPVVFNYLKSIKAFTRIKEVCCKAH